jgi:hypothetical protein
LALLKIKDHGYGYDDDSFQDSDILGAWNKAPKLSYEFESKVDTHMGSIGAYETDIIPLSWIDDSWITSSSNLTLTIGAWIVWNLIGSADGLSGSVGFNNATNNLGNKTLSEIWGKQVFAYSDISIGNFLVANPESYLLLYNTSNAPLSYELSGDDFSLPRATISSSAQIWKYAQNLETSVDNTKFLGILKYSIYSWN